MKAFREQVSRTMFIRAPAVRRGGMGDLTFVGLGLQDEKGVTLLGLDVARAADVVFGEFYTSVLPGARLDALESLIGKRIRVLSRSEVESGEVVIEAAKASRVVLLVGGDPMSATTHVDLRLRAHVAGIPTRIVHGVSILSAAAGALGLQAYKFGRTTTVPFPAPNFRPSSPLETILANLRQGLHTLVLLDLREDGTFLDPKVALREVLEAGERLGTRDVTADTIACVLSCVGSDAPGLRAERIRRLLEMDLGPPLHCLVIPGPLHFLEREALIAFAGAPHDIGGP